MNCLFLLLASLLSLASSFPTCSPFHPFVSFQNSTSVCSTVLPADYRVWIDLNLTCLQDIEQSTTVRGYPSYWFPLTSPCQLALSRYHCTLAYPGCSTNETTGEAVGPILPCPGVCDEIVSACSGTLDALVLQSAKFNLSALNCASPSSGPNSPSPCVAFPLPTNLTLPSCQPYRGTLCRGVVTYPIYVPATYTQEKLEAAASALSRVFAIAPRESGCSQSVVQFYCSQIFNMCDDEVVARALSVSPGLPMARLPFPRYPCKSVCERYQENCEALFALNEGLRPDCGSYGNDPDSRRGCNGSFVIRGQDNFPTRGTTFTNRSGVLLTTDCNPMNSSISTTAAAYDDCPYPLVHPQDYNDVDTWVVGSCALPCPLFTQTKANMRKDDYLYTVLIFPSFFFITLTLLTYTLFKRKYVNILNLVLACWIETFAVLLAAFVPHGGSEEFYDTSYYTASYRCVNNAAKPNIHNSGICGPQAFFLLLGTNAVPSWWGILAFDVWLSVVVDRNISFTPLYKKLRVFFYCYGWGVPLVLVITAMSVGPISNNNFMFCTHANQKYDWLTVYTVVFVNALIGLFCMVSVTYHVMRASRNTMQSVISRESVKLMLIVLAFFVYFTFAYGYRSYVESMRSDVSAGVKTWITCLLTHSSPGLNPQGICGSGPTPTLNPEATRIVIFLATSAGTVATVMFFDRQSFRFWKYFLSCPDFMSLKKMKGFDPKASSKGLSVSHKRIKDIEMSGVGLKSSRGDLQELSGVSGSLGNLDTEEHPVPGDSPSMGPIAGGTDTGP